MQITTKLLLSVVATIYGLFFLFILYQYLSYMLTEKKRQKEDKLLEDFLDEQDKIREEIEDEVKLNQVKGREKL